jgi:hypothetical protein
MGMAWLYQRPDSKKWWIGWRSNGRQFLKSTGTIDRKEAEKKLREQETLAQMHSDGRLSEVFVEAVTGQQRPKVTFRDAVQGWLIECKGATASATYEKYKQLSDELFTFLKASDDKPLLRDVTADEVRAFLNWKRERVSASTANVYRTILSGFFKRAMQNGQTRDNPMILVKTLKASQDEGMARQAET